MTTIIGAPGDTVRLSLSLTNRQAALFVRASVKPAIAGLPTLDLVDLFEGEYQLDVVIPPPAVFGAYKVRYDVFDSAADRTAGTPFSSAFPLAGTDTLILGIVAQPGDELAQNMVRDELAYAGGRPLSGRVREFGPSQIVAATAGANVGDVADDADSEKRRHRFVATYNGDGTLSTYKATREL